MLKEHQIEFRVRYAETDAMGYVHHSNYFTYFEMGRTEMLRAAGGDYRAMEDAGLFLVVVKIASRFHRPARYDDLLVLETKIARMTIAKIEHEYRLTRGYELLAEGQSTLACVDRDGRVQRIPESLHDV